MVIIHKERVAVPVLDMEPGTAFFNDSGDLLIVTDDKDLDEPDPIVQCVNIKTGYTTFCYKWECAVPVKITMVEVE